MVHVQFWYQFSLIPFFGLVEKIRNNIFISVDKHNVNIFYTAPTAIRALMKEGEKWVKQTSRKSLRVLATVGEPINPEAWNWFYEIPVFIKNRYFSNR